MSSTFAPTTHLPETKTICACRKEARTACAGDATYEHGNKKYCVMHYPSNDKANTFWNELKKKMDAEDYNFRGVHFPEGISFSGYKKTNEERFCFNKDANFDFATFSGEADFSNVMFNGEASFTFATFNNLAAFGFVIFGGAVNFNFAVFNEIVLFRATRFKKQVNFRVAQFKDSVRFWREQMDDEMFAEDASLTFDSLRIDKPERLSFRSVKLCPHWFINTDPRKFEFIEVDWDKFTFEQEREASKSDRLLSTAYRQLAMNAEENNLYIEATKFRYNSMNLRRLEKSNGRAFWTLDFWYWSLSGYGERVGRATVALLLILFLSCVPYWFTGFASSKDTTQNKIGAPIQVMLAPEQNKAKQFLATLVYSLETASLQKPEPRPVTTIARLFVGLETILAPLQAALLALAIRRKYMR